MLLGAPVSHFGPLWLDAITQRRIIALARPAAVPSTLYQAGDCRLRYSYRKHRSVTDITERGASLAECACMAPRLKPPKTSLLLEPKTPLGHYVIAAGIGLAFGLMVAVLAVLLIR